MSIGAATPVPPSQADWTPPEVEVGDLVLFSKDMSDRKSYPCFVLAVYPRHVDLVFAGGHGARNQVRHRDDPFLFNRPDLIADSGIWQAAQPTIRSRKIIVDLARLLLELESLKAEIQLIRTHVAEKLGPELPSKPPSKSSVIQKPKQANPLDALGEEI